MDPPAPTSTVVSVNDGAGRGQEQQGISLETFIASLAVAAVTFIVQLLVFVIVRRRLQRIYEPRTYLVPEKRRTRSAGSGLLAWLKPIFKTSSNDFIAKSGLDAYFFLRYLLMLLKIFGLLAIVILPILLPINYVGGRGDKDSDNPVRGLDKLAWTNISVTETNRYWAHLWLAIYAIIVFCYMFFRELRVYVRLRQAYLTSPQHRLRASATTVLVTSIPRKWLSIEKLLELYDILPGGVRNIWINRDFDELNEKVEMRDGLARMLERAETDLIRTAKKRHLKAQTKTAKREGGPVPEHKDMSEEGGVSSGDPHQIPRKHNSDANDPPNTRKNAFAAPIGLVGNLVEGGIDAVGDGVGKITHGIRGLGRGLKGVIPKNKIERSDPGEGASGDHEKKRRGSESSSSSDSSSDSSDDERRHKGSKKNPGRGSTLQEYEKKRRSAAIRADVNNEKVDSGDRSNPQGRNWKNKLKGQSEDDERPLAAASPISPTQPSRPTTAATQDGRQRRLNPVAPIIDIFKGKDDETVYPPAYDPQYENDNYGEPVWKRYLTEKDRPTHRLPLFSFLPSLPLIGQKVDTIHYCRKEVARLNVEIEQDQEEPEKFPLMNSAFIQFNNQVAAHMACQSLNHHIPQQMAPRYLEVNPNDVLWENMRIKWWERYLRVMLVSVMVAGLIIGWAFPVGLVGLISQVDYLQSISWLSWIGKIPDKLLSIISGVLPPLFLAILMALLPVILRTFAKIQGLHTGMSVELAVQGMYFAFLFVQVFLVVSISSGITATIKELTDNPASAAQVLAKNLPKASNFFFSYLLIQAFTQSGGALLQIGSLAVYYLLAPFFDVTARQKWARQTDLVEMKWGTFFPVYTNLACIGLVYSVISPLILIFNMFTFGLFWVVYRYNLLFVNNFKYDTGGLLFPKAINQLFTGIYVMEICLIGLFFLVRDQDNNVVCSPHGGIMAAVLLLTVLYQRALNKAFGPLITYLPLTLEDEAAERDRIFAREHDAHRRLTIAEEAGDDGDVNDALAQREAVERAAERRDEAIELEDIQRRKSGGSGKRRFSLGKKSRKSEDHWSAANPADTLKRLFPFTPLAPQTQAEKDLEAAEVADRRRRNQAEFALFDDIPDEIEDLSPEERDRLVSRAFQHSALRAKRPVIWIPRDDLGIADDEIWRTQRFSKHIWISNEYAGLDAKAKVTYKRSPPDFDARDLVDL